MNPRSLTLSDLFERDFINMGNHKCHLWTLSCNLFKEICQFTWIIVPVSVNFDHDRLILNVFTVSLFDRALRKFHVHHENFPYSLTCWIIAFSVWASVAWWTGISNLNLFKKKSLKKVLKEQCNAIVYKWWFYEEKTIISSWWVYKQCLDLSRLTEQPMTHSILQIFDS